MLFQTGSRAELLIATAHRDHGPTTRRFVIRSGKRYAIVYERGEFVVKEIGARERPKPDSGP